jgi:excisionase family DNA binding protein
MNALVSALLDELDDDSLDALAERLAPRLESRLSSQSEPDAWMTTNEAAAYLGMTANALHKLTASRTIPFAQDEPGARCYFKRSELDRWRGSGARGGRR